MVRAFVQRHYLWPLLPMSRGRAAWVLWRWWTWSIRGWYRRRTCREHEPLSRRIGTLREFLAGGNGRQQVVCAKCGIVMREFPA